MGPIFRLKKRGNEGRHENSPFITLVEIKLRGKVIWTWVRAQTTSFLLFSKLTYPTFRFTNKIEG